MQLNLSLLFWFFVLSRFVFEYSGFNVFLFFYFVVMFYNVALILYSFFYCFIAV